LKHALAQVAEINNDVDKKTTKGIYPALEVKGATGGADIHQFPMIQMAGGAAGGGWVWRSWTPQDIRGVKASMEECLKTNPRRAIQILHDQIKMQGETRTDIGFICTAVLPSSIWSSHAADWGVKVEDEADNTLNQHLPAGNEREAQAVYRGRVQALMDELATAMAPRVMDWQAIQEVTQDAKESPAEYKTRLYEQIELHSGYDNPAEIPRHFLNTMFVDGLCDEVRKEVKADMPGWKTAEVVAVFERARQAWQTLREEERRGKKTERALIVRNLELKSRKYEDREGRPRRDNPDWEPRYEAEQGQRRPWNRENEPRRQGECFNCGKFGHWSRECKAPPRQRGWGPRPPQQQERPTAPPREYERQGETVEINY